VGKPCFGVRNCPGLFLAPADLVEPAAFGTGGRKPRRNVAPRRAVLIDRFGAGRRQSGFRYGVEHAAVRQLRDR